jgi:ABC-type antimicrobial peptide transport system permease subunit
MSSSSGTIVMSRRRYADAWHDPTANRLNVFLAPGASGETVAEGIKRALDGSHRLKVHALGEALAYIDAKIREAFTFSRSLQLLVVIVAIAGIFDLLLARIHERRRELAVWRVVGADEHAVRGSLLVESLALAAASCALGFPFGLATAWLWVRQIIPRLLGYDIALSVPVLPCVATVAVVTAATLAAGRTAAASATRMPVLDGLRTD